MEDIIKKIYDYSLEEIMGERFGKYSKYIIQDRAIPDVRDGLKPVQRRILFSMYKEKNTYDKPYKKSARAVGDVMGKYHPHGDSSIYDAIVRMSQDWKMKEPFIDMQGNNGSIDGDSAAASRYTEARLSKIAGAMLKDIEKDTVVMAPNYDDTLLEPTVLPAKFPNLLVNGTTGISAGYATNIPPHNLKEVIDATIFRIDNPNSRLETIMNYIKGPDFPTGAIIEGIDGIKSAYETGRGRIIIKSKARIEKNKIIITEIPYEVNKALLVRKMDEIRIDKKIDGIAEVRDESDKDGLQITVDLKKDANAQNILNYFYKNTELQISYNFNMVVIVNRRPMLLGVLGILDAYIAHQREIIKKRSEFDLAHAKSRYHIVEGLIKAISILDEVITTIRKSKDRSDSINNLINKFNFTEKQATAIVDMRLYRLSNTDIKALEEEQKNLLDQMKELEEILNDSNKLDSAVSMGIAVTFVLVLTAAVSWMIQYYILVPFKIEFLQTILFIIVIAALVQFVEMVVRKTSESLYLSLGIYLPLITTNCCVLGLALFGVLYKYNFIQNIVFALGAGIGFTLALVIMASIRERLTTANIPEAFKGPAMPFITAGILALIFYGFSGIIKI